MDDTNLSFTNLSNADLGGAYLDGARLIQTNVSAADFDQTSLSETAFVNVDLSDVKGLDRCRHDRPSPIDHRTFALSKTLPIVFLRGCGLSDQFIDYIPSLFNPAIRFHSCFISYATKDQEFADRLYADLQNKGVRCWFSTHHIQGGKKIHEQIDDAIRVYDRLLLILSKNSIGSEWVKTEIANARQREINEKRQMLFPISIAPFESVRQWKAFDADTGKDSAREIREYFIPDFSNWKDHDSYHKAFERLLRDLKADEAKAQNS